MNRRTSWPDWLPAPQVVRSAIAWGLFAAVAIWGALVLLLSLGGM